MCITELTENYYKELLYFIGEELIDDTGLLSNNDVSKMDETLGKLDKDDDTFPVGNSVVESQGIFV